MGGSGIGIAVHIELQQSSKGMIAVSRSLKCCVWCDFVKFLLPLYFLWKHNEYTLCSSSIFPFAGVFLGCSVFNSSYDI